MAAFSQTTYLIEVIGLHSMTFVLKKKMTM